MRRLSALLIGAVLFAAEAWQGDRGHPARLRIKCTKKKYNNLHIFLNICMDMWEKLL